jgi:co-chaperonin GroES (HSP10)
VGDRVLIKPESDMQKTNSGLYLPPNVREKEKVHAGYVIKVGPGYPLAAPTDDEPWKPQKETKYIPLQAQEGDYALYLKRDAVEIEIDGEKMVIVPQSAILLLLRDEELFE